MVLGKRWVWGIRLSLQGVFLGLGVVETRESCLGLHLYWQSLIGSIIGNIVPIQELLV